MLPTYDMASRQTIRVNSILLAFASRATVFAETQQRHTQISLTRDHFHEPRSRLALHAIAMVEYMKMEAFSITIRGQVLLPVRICSQTTVICHSCVSMVDRWKTCNPSGIAIHRGLFIAMSKNSG